MLPQKAIPSGAAAPIPVTAGNCGLSSANRALHASGSRRWTSGSRARAVSRARVPSTN